MMDTTYTIQVQKPKLASETLTDLAKEHTSAQEINSQPAERNVNSEDQDEREHLNGEMIQLPPRTPAIKNGGGHSPVAAEQNSSGFGDEIGPDEIKSSDSDEDNATPNIFQTDNLTLEERLQAYANIFLAKSELDDGTFDIHQEMYHFLTEEILGCWTSIWKVDNNCDAIVEVDMAPHPESRQQHLRAKVHLSEPFQCILDGDPCIQEKSEQTSEVEVKIRALLERSEGLVDLTDLYPIFNKTGILDNTALAIEHARFFYQILWRPMDDEDEWSGSTYMNKCLKPRLKFIYDVQEKRIAAHIVRKHQQALSECLDKYERFTALQGQLGDSDGTDGDELDMNDSCMAVDIMALNEEVEVLKMKLERLENPVLRSLMDIPSGMLSERRSMGSQSRGDSSLKTFLVTETLTAGMIQNLNLGPDVVIEHCKSPGEALTLSLNGDTILIFPGSYTGERFYTLQQPVTIKGVGTREEIVIRCEELADIFLDCDTLGATISNLTLEDENDATGEGLVAVRAGGSLVMDGCVLRSGGTGVNIFRGGTLEMTRCEIKDIKRNGVRCKAGSSVQLSEADIHHCGLDLEDEDEENKENQGDEDDITTDHLMAGIMIEIQEGDEKDNRTTLTLNNTQVHDNQGAGIVVLVASNREEEPEPITTDVIGLVSGIEVRELKNNKFSCNVFGDAMLARFVDN